MVKRKIILMLDSSRTADRGMIRGVVNYSNSRGEWAFYRISPLFKTFPFSGNSSADEIWQKLINLDADGIIGYLPEDDSLLDNIRARGFPAVIQPVVSVIDGLINISQDGSTATMAADYLIGLGFKNFGYCGMNYCWSKVRQDYFSKKVLRSGFSLSVAPEDALDSDKLIAWLKSLTLPVAIMACNDERGAELIEACRLADIDVPREVSIIGVDNDEMVCSLCNPPLSSIKMNFEALGYSAAEAIDRLLSGKGKDIVNYEELCCRPIEIVTRASTDLLEIEDIEVANAIAFIRKNARRAITVLDVQKNSLLSLRGLQLRFKKALNRSIHQEISRERIAEMARQLVNTNLTVQEIAYSMEFYDVNHISRIFKKETGMTPIEYRRKLGQKF